MIKNPRKEYLILGLGALLFIVVNFSLQFAKYRLFLYNSLDLAIFNNVFFNLANNLSFFSSVRNISYLADHFTPLMFLLLPFYKIYQNPLTLLFLQTIVLAVTPFLIFKLSKTIIESRGDNGSALTQKLPLWFAVFWLINPLVWNINLFEFHLLPLAAPLLFGAFIFYFKNNFVGFFLLLFFTCLVREDTTLVVFMIGIIAWLDKKNIKYILTPLLFSVVYFLLAISITGHFSTEGFRFFVYYDWMGESLGQIIQNFFIHPIRWISHLATISNLNMLVGLFFPFLFLPLLRPKFLLLSLLPLAQFTFSLSGGSNIIVQTHYAALFLPALFLATLDAVLFLIKKKQSKIHKLINFDPALSKIIIPLILILSFFALSPLRSIAIEAKGKTFSANNAFNLPVPDNNETTAGSLGLLPLLSSRSDSYAIYYLFPGLMQYSDKPYTPRREIDKIYLDQNELLTHWIKQSFFTGGAEKYHEYFQVWQKKLSNYPINFAPPEVFVFNLENQSNLASFFKNQQGKEYCREEKYNQDYNLIKCWFTEPWDEVYFLDINKGEKTIPAIWREKNDQGYLSGAMFFQAKDEKIISLEKIKIKGQIELGPWLTAENKIYSKETIGKITWRID